MCLISLWLQAREIESTIEPLEKRCQKLIKGSRKYAEGISHFAESQTLFASFLEEFCGGADGHDEESMLLGTALVLLESFIRRPFTQIVDHCCIMGNNICVHIALDWDLQAGH